MLLVRVETFPEVHNARTYHLPVAISAVEADEVKRELARKVALINSVYDSRDRDGVTSDEYRWLQVYRVGGCDWGIVEASLLFALEQALGETVDFTRNHR